MKLGGVSAVVVAVPVALGAGGVALTKGSSEGKVKEMMEKASAAVKANENHISFLKRLSLPNVVLNKKADNEQSKRGMAFHMLERKKVNGCSYKIKIGKHEHDLSTVFKANRVMSDAAGRAFLELDITKDWRKYGEEIIDSACFKSKNVTVERHPSSAWRGWHYWLVTGKDENNKEVYRNWFWQK